MPTQRVKNLVEAIVQVYVSYGFTDWPEAVKESVAAYGEEGTDYSDAEVIEAERLAMTMSRSLKQHYDTLSKEVLG